MPENPYAETAAALIASAARNTGTGRGVVVVADSASMATSAPILRDVVSALTDAATADTPVTVYRTDTGAAPSTLEVPASDLSDPSVADGAALVLVVSDGREGWLDERLPRFVDQAGERARVALVHLQPDDSWLGTFMKSAGRDRSVTKTDGPNAEWRVDAPRWRPPHWGPDPHLSGTPVPLIELRPDWVTAVLDSEEPVYTFTTTRVIDERRDRLDTVGEPVESSWETSQRVLATRGRGTARLGIALNVVGQQRSITADDVYAAAEALGLERTTAQRFLADALTRRIADPSLPVERRALEFDESTAHMTVQRGAWRAADEPGGVAAYMAELQRDRDAIVTALGGDTGTELVLGYPATPEAAPGRGTDAALAHVREERLSRELGLDPGVLDGDDPPALHPGVGDEVEVVSTVEPENPLALDWNGNADLDRGVGDADGDGPSYGRF